MISPQRFLRYLCRPTTVAVVLAGVFSVLVMLPSLLQQQDAQYPFQGVHILGPDAEVYYAARVQEVYDGFPGLGSPFYSAPKDLPYVQPPLPEMTIAAMGKILRIDAISAFLLAKILLAAAAYIALTLLLFSVTRRPWISILSAFVTLAAGALLAAPWDVVPFFTGKNFSYEFLRFARLLHPQWTTTITFFALWCLVEWLRTGRRLLIVGASCLTASLVYAYVYAWSYLFATVGVLCLWFLVLRDRRRVTDLALFWILTLVLALPYMWHTFVLMQHPWYAETAMRSGMVLRHGPAIVGVWAIAFVLLAVASRRLWPGAWPFLPAVSLAGIIALNQHLVTGHFIVPHHYHWYYIQPLASAFFVVALLHLLSVQRYGTLVAVVSASVLVVGSSWWAVMQQSGAYAGVRDLWGSLQHAAPVFQYVREHMQPGSVVYSQDVHIENLIPVFTSADVFYAGNANLSLVPDERARYTYFFDLWLQGVTPEDVAREFPTTRRWMLGSRIHAIYYREAAGDFAAMPDDEVAKHIEAYRAFFAMSLREKLVRYPLTAVITTPSDPANQVWTSFLSCSQEVVSSGGYGVRLMIPAGNPGTCL